MRTVRGRAVAASLCYIVWALGASMLAIARDLPANFGGISTGLSTTNDFLIGFGTALSPPLWWLLVQAFFTARASRTSAALPVKVLIGFGAMECIGALGEPVTLQAFSPTTFEPLLAATQFGMITLPLAAAILGVRALRNGR
jgi:hypothetical protein